MLGVFAVVAAYAASVESAEDVCARWLEQVEKSAPERLAQLRPYYGPDASCWREPGDLQARCRIDCSAGLAAADPEPL